MKYHIGIWLFLLTYLMSSLQVVLQIHICEEDGVSLHLFSQADTGCCTAEQAPVACHIMGDECPFAPKRRLGAVRRSK